MLILTILLSLTLAALFTLLPARIHHRRSVRADLYAGAGVSALVWLWAVCVWSKPGLSVGFDAFRLAAILIMQAIACGVVCGFRLRGTLPQKLRTPAAVGLLLAASLGIELFVGNLNWLATHSYTPVDLRPYLVNDADPAAPLTLNDEQTTLEFAGLDFAIYNLQLDGLTSLADGNTPEQKNVLLTLNVAATDEASSVSRQSWNWETAPASARSQTHSLDLSGKASTLTLTASGYTGEYRSYPLNAQLTTVYANARRPLDFSVLRFAIIFALALAAFALRPASAAWQDAYLTHEKKYRPAVLAVGLGVWMQRDVVQINLVGASNNPCVVSVQNGQAVVFFRGGESNWSAVQNYLAGRSRQEPALVVDLRAKPTQMEFSAAEIVTVQELADFTTRPVLDGLTLDLYHNKSANLAVLGVGERHIAVGAGRLELAEPVRVDVLCAPGTLSDSVRPDAILYTAAAPRWLDDAAGCTLRYGEDTPGLTLRPGRSMIWEEAQTIAVQ